MSDQTPRAIERITTDETSVAERLGRNKLAVVLAVGFAALIAIFSSHRVDTDPLRLTPRTASYGFAVQLLVVDSATSTVSNAQRQLGPLSDRAEVFASLMTSDPVRLDIAQRLGVPPDQIALTVRKDGLSIGDNTDALDQLEAITKSSTRYQLTFKAERRGSGGSLGLPLVSMTAQAPTREAAERAANAAGVVARTFFDRRARRTGVSAKRAVRLTPIGQARGVTVNSSVGKAVTVLAGAAALFALLTLVVLIDRVGDRRRAARAAALESAQTVDELG